MKKVFSLILTLSILSMACAAWAVTPAQLVKDPWYLVSIDGNGVKPGVSAQLNRDKSITITAYGETIPTDNYTWKIETDSIIISEGSSYRMTFEYLWDADALTVRTSNLGILSGDNSVHDYVWAKNAVSYYTPAGRDAASEEEFYGSYVSYLVVAKGAYIESDEASITLDFAEAEIDGDVYMTDFSDGHLVIDEQGNKAVIEVTEDPDVIIFNELNKRGDAVARAVYMRRAGAEAPAAPAVSEPEAIEAPAIEPEPIEVPSVVSTVDPEPIEVTGIEPEPIEVPSVVSTVDPEPIEVTGIEPEPIEVPSVVSTVDPEPIEVTGIQPEPIDVPSVDPESVPAPAFPAMIDATPAEAAPAADDPAAAFFGTYKVYQDRLPDGTTLDLSSYGMTAVISAGQVEVTAYGRTITVPYEYTHGFMNADISEIYPKLSKASAILADNGEMIVVLSDADDIPGETLFLMRVD